MLIAVLSCALAGCWEEIHYSPPPASSTVAESPPPAEESAEPTDEPTQNFADDVANSLAGETASAVGDLPSEPINPEPTPPVTEPTPLPSETTVAEVNASEPGTDATPAPTANSAPADPARSPRRMAWLLGSNLSLSALGNDRGIADDRVADWFDKSRRLAALLNTTAADLPPRPAAGEIDPSAARAMEYLFDQGQSIGRHLAAQFGDDHAALFELALKSNILLVRYQPDAPVVKALSAAISQSGERAKVPPELCQPLLKLLDENAPAKDVRNAVFDMHANIDRYLSTTQP